MISVFPRHSALAGLAAVLVVGCAHGNPQPSGVATQPRNYAIQNLTSCFARIHSMNPDGSSPEVLTEVRPGQEAEVTLAKGLRLVINTHRGEGTAYRDDHPRRTTSFEVVSYGDDCRKTGQVVVMQGAARVL